MFKNAGFVVISVLLHLALFVVLPFLATFEDPPETIKVVSFEPVKRTPAATEPEPPAPVQTAAVETPPTPPPPPPPPEPPAPVMEEPLVTEVESPGPEPVVEPVMANVEPEIPVAVVEEAEAPGDQPVEMEEERELPADPVEPETAVETESHEVSESPETEIAEEITDYETDPSPDDRTDEYYGDGEVPSPADLEEYIDSPVPEDEAFEVTVETETDAVSLVNVAESEEEIAEAEVLSDREITEEESAPEEEPEMEPEEVDRRVDLPLIETFVGDRIQGQIEFTGKGRKLVSTPTAPDFRLTGNTNVAVNFKIDRNGRPYDIVVPPVGREIEIMLTDFVGKMRFSAVLYSEPDTATMRVSLRVR